MESNTNTQNESVVVYEMGDDVTRTEDVYTVADDVDTYAVPAPQAHDVTPRAQENATDDVMGMVDNQVYKSMDDVEPEMRDNVLYNM